jgi:hypothetical protein
MALNLTVTLPTGVAASYWKASILHIDNVRCTITATIEGYLNYSAYVAGSSPLTEYVEIINPTQYAQIMASANLIIEFYTILSQMPDFAGSTVVP